MFVNEFCCALGSHHCPRTTAAADVNMCTFFLPFYRPAPHSRTTLRCVLFILVYTYKCTLLIAGAGAVMPLQHDAARRRHRARREIAFGAFAQFGKVFGCTKWRLSHTINRSPGLWREPGTSQFKSQMPKTAAFFFRASSEDKSRALGALRTMANRFVIHAAAGLKVMANKMVDLSGTAGHWTEWEPRRFATKQITSSLSVERFVCRSNRCRTEATFNEKKWSSCRGCDFAKQNGVQPKFSTHFIFRFFFNSSQIYLFFTRRNCRRFFVDNFEFNLFVNNGNHRVAFSCNPHAELMCANQQT